jgi:ATP phosphoribosyltransferase
VIVDITTTGATLKDNGLKILDDGVILKSQAQLAASLTADWNVQTRKACETLLAKLDPANPLYPALARQLPR